MFKYLGISNVQTMLMGSQHYPEAFRLLSEFVITTFRRWLLTSALFSLIPEETVLFCPPTLTALPCPQFHIELSGLGVFCLYTYHPQPLLYVL